MHRSTAKIAALTFTLAILFSSSSAFTTKKLFEQTVYNIKNMAFVNEDTGWAVGDIHWDQTTKSYVSTIIATVDGGNAWVERTSEGFAGRFKMYRVACTSKCTTPVFEKYTIPCLICS